MLTLCLRFSIHLEIDMLARRNTFQRIFITNNRVHNVSNASV